MISQRNKPVAIAAISLVAVWLLAWGGYTIAQNSRATADKVRAYLHGTDLKTLTGEARARRLRRLADLLSALAGEERRQARMDGGWNRLFAEMTDQEKLDFVDATLPSGVKQMLDSFEKLEATKRKKAIEDATRRLREARENPQLAQGPGGNGPGLGGGGAGGNGPPTAPLNEEMQKKIMVTGLNTFYKQSSAQTKAEMAPLLEEIQRSMESGRLFRGP